MDSSQIKSQTPPPSLKLGLVAMLLWFGSLALPAVIYSGHKNSGYGIEILAMGAAGPLLLNFAWYANIFCVVALFKLADEESASITAAGWAVVLSLNSFTLARMDYMVPAAGLGLGAMLWLLAIALMFIAAAIKRKEITGESKYLRIGLCYFISLVSLICFLIYINQSQSHPDRGDEWYKWLVIKTPILSLKNYQKVELPH